MGSFRRGIRIFRSQDVEIESRPSFLGKTYPIKFMLLTDFVFLNFLLALFGTTRGAKWPAGALGAAPSMVSQDSAKEQTLR